MPNYSIKIASPAGSAPIATFEVAPDGIWTWFTDPRAVVRAGFLYVMFVDSAGTCRINRTNLIDKSVKSFQLSSTALEVDDHNNGSCTFDSTGRLIAYYGQHNDPTFRYRIWDGVGDFALASSWTAEAARGNSEGPYSYPGMYQFPADTSKSYLFTRRWTDGSGTTRTFAYRTTTALTGSSDPWSAYTDVLLRTNQRPYVKHVMTGTNRIDVAISSAQPNEDTFISVLHMYGQLDGSNNLRWYKTNGTEIVAALPFNPLTEATLVDDGTGKKRWISDIAVGADGHPRILWMLYPNGDGTDIRYMYSRWTGSAWTAQAEICRGGTNLYAGEIFYHGGLCFDFLDPDRVYLSESFTTAQYQIQEWRTINGGTSWSKVRDITTGAYTGIRSRPYSPRNNTGNLRVLWFEGTYDTFTSYNTKIYGAG